jgi:hypothetical protein
MGGGGRGRCVGFTPVHIAHACEQIEGDEAFLQRVGRGDLLPKLPVARAAAVKEDKVQLRS